MERPVVADLDGLIQFIARPNSRFAAAWVARSSLIGMSDAELQSFLSTRQHENLLSRLIEYSSNPRQRALVQRWIDLSSSGRIVDLLQETIDQSDLLTAHCDEGSIQDVERFIDEVRSISDSVGGDAIVIADRLRDLREQTGRALEAKKTPERDAVQLMTIHNSKGLESKVVFVTDLFSAKGIITLTNETQSRLIVSPEFFAGHPAPWPGDKYPISAMWEHAKKIAQKRKNAEARRLLYVAATRAEEHLVIVGSPDKTNWQEDSGLHLPWRYSATQTTLGQMWIESLRQASHRRGESSDDSPWLSIDDDNQPHPLNSENGPDRILNPGSLRFDGWLRAEQEGHSKMGINIYHNPECLISENADENVLHSPLVRQTMLHEAATDERVADSEISSRLETGARIRLAPHRLSKIDSCPRRNWFETRGGLKPDSISSSNQLLDEDDDSRSPRQMDEPNIEYEDSNLPSPTELGLIVHRMFEVGIGNPGPSGDKPSMPIPTTWSNEVNSRLLDGELMTEVFAELLPKGVDVEKTSEIVSLMMRRIEEGHVGRLSNAEIINGERVEGLRTEYPFSISNQISFEQLSRTRWTPDGEQNLANISNAFVDMDGSIDLVLCSTHQDGSSSIRPVDLKTEQAESILTGSGKLLDAYGNTSTSPANEAELDMLEHHRLQLALYHR
ncbi:MAG: 3'-5' exonuclease, partial [Euryarchaeota archaeon]